MNSTIPQPSRLRVFAAGVKKLTLILTLPCILSVSNVLAESKHVSGGAVVVETGSSYDDSDSTRALWVDGNSTSYTGTDITLSGTNTSTSYYDAVAYVSSGSLSLTGGSITANTTGYTGSGKFGILVYGGGNTTLSGVDIVATGDGSGPTAGIGNISSYGHIQVNLNNNILLGDNYSIVVASLTNTGTASTITVTGSNGSLISGSVYAITYGIVEITLTGADTILHGDLINVNTYMNDINLTLGDGASLYGGGVATNLTLNDGAILGYTDGLTVTTSITVGDNITIDFSSLTETGEYTVLDWSSVSSSGDITAAQFTATGDGVEGTFSVANNQLTFNATAVPEPSTWFLIGVGLGALALIRRRSS